jgi:hypothetical protein
MPPPKRTLHPTDNNGQPETELPRLEIEASRVEGLRLSFSIARPDLSLARKCKRGAVLLERGLSESRSIEAGRHRNTEKIIGEQLAGPST